METTTKISKYVAESGHWYDRDGLPAYTIKGKNGKERNTTLRDARKEGYVPSVTTIIRESNKPGLENWKQDQVLMAALTLPRIEGETDQQLIARIKEDAKQQAIKAAERGTQVHKWVQQGFEGVDLEGEAYNYYLLVRNLLEVECGEQTWTVEQSFIDPLNRYGGKIDLHCPDFIFDIKTKEDIEDAKTWDEHYQQLAAYARGVGNGGKAGIIFVSTTSLAAKIAWIEPDKLVRGMKMFDALTDYWYAKTGL